MPARILCLATITALAGIPAYALVSGSDAQGGEPNALRTVRRVTK